MDEPKAKESAYVRSPSSAILKEISAVRTTLDNLLTQDEELKIRFVRQLGNSTNMEINLGNT